MRRWGLFCLITYFFVGAFEARAVDRDQVSCRKIIVAMNRLMGSDSDSSVELELPRSEQLFKIFTTTNGRVSGVLRRQPTPRWFADWVKKKFGKTQNPREVPWENIPYLTQVALLKEIVKVGKLDFIKNRNFKGLVVKSHLTLNFDRPTVFLGMAYPKGSFEFDLSSVMVGTVQFANVDAIEDLSDFEIHFRAPGLSGDVSQDARTFLKARGLKKTYQHVHIVAHLPLALLSNPFVYGSLMADYFRRLNLVAEMITIVEEGGNIFNDSGIDGKARRNILTFSSLSQATFNLAANSFFILGFNLEKGVEYKMGWNLKAAWVGARGPDSYDQENRWGIEYRAIDTTTPTYLSKNILDAIQWSMHKEDFGLLTTQMEAWLKDHGANPYAKKSPLRKTWYNRTSIGPTLPPAVKAAFSESQLEQAMLRINSGGAPRDQHLELKMLLFDWSQDPLFYNDKKFVKALPNSQIRGIRRLIRGDNENAVMVEFLNESGLYDRFLKSVNLQRQ